MVNVIETEYWSKADAFLLPLTGLSKREGFELNAYLFWNQYSIEDYKLTLSFSYDDYSEFLLYCRDRLFPILDKHTNIVENYDIEGRSIFVLDMSEWAMDIEMFIEAKYSKFSRTVKDKIEEFHLIGKNKVPIYIYAVLYPHQKMQLLDGKTPIEYVAEMYDWDLETIQAIGEIGSKYDRLSETLLTEINDLC